MPYPSETLYPSESLFPGGPPTVTTLPATGFTPTKATLNGTVNPNGLPTTYYFEYGETESYGTKVPASEDGDAGEGSGAVVVSEAIKGLKPNTTYHFRLVAENAEGKGVGEDAILKTTTWPSRRKPPLALDLEIEDAEGNTHRLPSDSRKARNRPREMTFNTQRGDGDATGGAQLSRAIFRDYPDIGLMDTWRMIGKQGDVAYEGRLHSNPRTNDPEEQIDIALVGWMTYLKSRRVNPIIIDRRLNQWGEASREYQAARLADGRKMFSPQTMPDDRTRLPSLKLAVHEPFPAGARCAAVYASPDSRIGEVRYSRQKLAGENFGWLAALHADAAVGTALDEDNGLINTAVSNGSIAAAGAFYAKLVLWADGAGGGSAETADAWNDLRVIGPHGLEALGSQPNEGFGLTAILRWILATYYPKVRLAGWVNNFPVTQATWNDAPATGYDIAQWLNNFVLWETNMREDRTLYHEPADLTRIDWQIRTDDPGVTVLFQGDSIENFANGVEVTYTDFTGQRRTLYPSDHAELRDDSESNPANRHGEALWTDVDVPRPCSEFEALQFGRAYLAEFNRPKRPGTYRVDGGYIKDAAGHWHQGWKPKNGQTLGIMDHPDDAPRLIVATSWVDDGKALMITVDAPDKMLDAVVARHEMARQGRNLV